VRELLVASTGGHLLELHRLRPRLVPRADHTVWLTADSRQSRSLLAGEEVVNIGAVAPRDLRAVIANTGVAGRLVRESGADRVVSTGAGIALSIFPSARLRGVPCHYIESAARIDGPSTTGRLLRAARFTHLYSQHPRWAVAPWHYRGSVFDNMASKAVDPVPVRRVVVSLGTLDFPFDRLVRRLVEILPSDAEVLWQMVPEPGVDVEGRVRTTMPSAELEAAMEAADLVICHAGVGSALTALSVGKCPVLVPRRASFGEHVDDHQLQVAEMLAERGLVVTCEADEITTSHLLEASGLRTTTTDLFQTFRLGR
jgi:UDP-N-acetylglucosamine transferase subunit ALG13